MKNEKSNEKINSREIQVAFALEGAARELEGKLGELRLYLDDSPKANMRIPKHYISNRLENLLVKNGVGTFKALAKRSGYEIASWRYCGAMTIDEITKLVDVFMTSPAELKASDQTAAEHTVAAQLREISASKKYRISNYSKELGIKYSKAAKAIAEEFIALAKLAQARPRDYEVWTDYYGVGKAKNLTLQAIGNSYGLTRERIRQVIDKYNSRISERYHGPEGAQTFDKIDGVLCEIGANKFYEFVKYGCLQEYSPKFIKYTFSVLFDEKFAADVIFVCTKQNIKKAQIKYEGWFEKMCKFPSGDKPCTLDISKLKSTRTLSFGYFEKAKKTISELSDVDILVDQPNLIYSKSFKTAHRPDFLIKTESGKLALVVVLPTINLCIYYNLKRFNDLKEFAEKNNLGYLVMTDRFKTLDELIATEVDDELKAELDGVLNEKGTIMWSDVKDIKTRRAVSNEAIVSYVINNKLRFMLSPFSISPFNGAVEQKELFELK